MSTSVYAEAVIGRENELRAIDEFLEQASGGSAALILEGEAGIGKTTLWKHGVEAARAKGASVLFCRPGAGETQLSFAGLDDLLSEVAEETLPELPPPQRHALEVALLLDEARGEPPDQRAIAVAFLGVLRRIGADGPVLVAVDDVQWVDRPSTFVLEFAARRLADVPVGFLLAQRPEAAGRVPFEIDQALSEKRLHRISLEPLSLGGLQELLRTRLDASFPRPTLRRVQEISGGNPFFALELARALMQRGGTLAPGDDLPVPGNLHELVRDRLELLPEASREVVLAVAALAQPTEALVVAALGSSAEQGLAKAAEAGVIEFERGRIRFTHPLLGSAVSSQASSRRRGTLHRRLTEIVDDPEERARHLALASAKPDATVASALDVAARRARARGAPDAAAELAEHALELTPEGAVDDRYRRRLEAAEHHFTGGNPERAAALLEEAFSVGESGAERARALHELARVRLLTTGAAAARDIAKEALADAQSDDRLRAGIEVDLTWWTSMTEGLPAAMPHARAALELSERLGDEALLVAALVTVVTFELTLGHGLRQELVDRALEHEASLGERASAIPMFLRPRTNLFEYRLLEGDLDAARSNLEARLALVDQDDPKSRPGHLTIHADIELRTGNWARAAGLVDEAELLADQFGLELIEPRMLKAQLLVLGGEVDAARAEAEQTLARAVERGKRQARTLGVLGFLELSLGNAAEAHGFLGAALREMQDAGVREPAMLTSLPDDVEALVLLGRLEEAQALLEPFEEDARRLDRPWALAVSARCRGLVSAAQGDLPRAIECFERALELHDRLPMPFERARTLLALGVTRRRAKQRRAARESLQAALAIFEKLGASLWIDRARAELSRIAGRAPSPGGLTSTERRVADLVAAGRTNREVAAALHLSERTVEGNLSRIYGKLGVRSRTELARRYAAEEAASANS